MYIWKPYLAAHRNCIFHWLEPHAHKELCWNHHNHYQISPCQYKGTINDKSNSLGPLKHRVTIIIYFIPNCVKPTIYLFNRLFFNDKYNNRYYIFLKWKFCNLSLEEKPRLIQHKITIAVIYNRCLVQASTLDMYWMEIYESTMPKHYVFTPVRVVTVMTRILDTQHKSYN